MGENLGLTSRSEALHCRLSAGSAELRCLVLFAFSLQRVWLLQLVPLSLAPHILITLARMCKGVPEKTVHWNVFFLSCLSMLWAKSEWSMERNERIGLPKGNKILMVINMIIFWVRNNDQNHVFLSLSLTWYWRASIWRNFTFVRCIHSMSCRLLWQPCSSQLCFWAKALSCFQQEWFGFCPAAVFLSWETVP